MEVPRRGPLAPTTGRVVGVRGWRSNVISRLLGGVAELLAGLLHGGLEVLAGLFPGLVLEGDGAGAHALAGVLAGVLAAAPIAGAIVHALALVFLDRGTVGLARTVVFLARHLAFAGGVQTATDVRLLEEERFLGVLRLGLVV